MGMNIGGGHFTIFFPSAIASKYLTRRVRLKSSMSLNISTTTKIQNLTTSPWIIGCIGLLDELLEVVVSYETVWADIIQNSIKALTLSLPKHFQHV